MESDLVARMKASKMAPPVAPGIPGPPTVPTVPVNGTSVPALPTVPVIAPAVIPPPVMMAPPVVMAPSAPVMMAPPVVMAPPAPVYAAPPPAPVVMAPPQVIAPPAPVAPPPVPVGLPHLDAGAMAAHQLAAYPAGSAVVIGQHYYHKQADGSITQSPLPNTNPEPVPAVVPPAPVYGVPSAVPSSPLAPVYVPAPASMPQMAPPVAPAAPQVAAPLPPAGIVAPNQILPPDAPSRFSTPEEIAAANAPKKKGRPSKKDLAERAAAVASGQPDPRQTNILGAEGQITVPHNPETGEVLDTSNGCTLKELYIDCIPTKGAPGGWALAEDIIGEIVNEVAEAHGVPDYGLIDFGKGKSGLAASLRQKLGELPQTVVVMSHTRGADIFVEICTPYAERIVRALRG